MSKTGLFDHIGKDHIFLSVDAAVQAFLTRPPAGASPPKADEGAAPAA